MLQPLEKIKFSYMHLNNPISTSDTDTFQEQTLEINKLIWKNHKTTSAPDISSPTEPIVLNQHKYNASSLYEWNIDEVSKYNILNTFQQMTMATNAYKPKQEPQTKP